MRFLLEFARYDKDTLDRELFDIKNKIDSDIDVINNFVKKYKKTNYISSSNIKKLNDTFLNSDDIQNILFKINKSKNFFENKDVDLLEQFLIEFYDEFPIFDRNLTEFKFRISYSSKHLSATHKCSDFPSNSIDSSLDSMEVLYEIINRIVNSYKSQLDIYSKRNSEDFMNRVTYRMKLNEKDSIGNIKVYPSIIVKMHTSVPPIFMSGTSNYNLKNEFFQKFRTHLDLIFCRYMSAIGYTPMTAPIVSKGYNNGNISECIDMYENFLHGGENFCLYYSFGTSYLF